MGRGGPGQGGERFRSGNVRDQRLEAGRLKFARGVAAPAQAKDFMAAPDQFLPERQAEFSPSELAGVERALAWSRPGDLLVLTVHAERGRVEDLLTRRVAAVARGGVEDARG